MNAVPAAVINVTVIAFFEGDRARLRAHVTLIDSRRLFEQLSAR